MAINTTTILSDSVRAAYEEEYIRAAMGRRVYDQFCFPISQDKEKLQRSSSVNVPFLSAMTPGTTAISQTVDITPQTLRDTTTSITPTSRGEAIQDSELILLQSYTNYGAERFIAVGENMMESVEANCIAAALAGSVVVRGQARASLDAGTSTDNLAHSFFVKAANYLYGLRCPGFAEVDINGGATFGAAVHPDAYYDLRTTSNVKEISQYQKPEIILNGELGSLDRFRLIVSPWCKVFNGAGVANASSAATTLSAAEEAQDKAIGVASGTNISVGRYLSVGTIETGSTFYPTNERVVHVSGTTTSVIVGSGSNGGLRYDHAAASAVVNSDSVYPVLFAGPRSIAKVYATDVGEYGQVVGPKLQGLVDQFTSLGWKWYGAYGRISESWLVRGEFSSTLDG